LVVLAETGELMLLRLRCRTVGDVEGTSMGWFLLFLSPNAMIPSTLTVKEAG